MESSNFKTRSIWVFVTFLGIFLTLYMVLHSIPFPIYSSDISKTSFSGESYNNDIIITPKLKVIIPTLQLGRARYDNQRMYRIYDFYFTGNNWESLVDQYDICFATQTSLERMHWIPYILERWTGPLSIAIQLISEEEWLIFNLYMNYLTKCHSTFENQVAMHLAVPSNLSVLKVDDKILSQWEGISLKAILEKGDTCPEAKQYLKYLLDTLPTTDKRKLSYKEFYPQNHMRNIARKGCGTHWTYTTDVETIPSTGMADKLQQFYAKQKTQGNEWEKCAYVIPTFELNYTFSFPESKKELVELFRIGATQPFHINVYKPGQEATDYELWISNKVEDAAVTISHEINRTKLKRYEPFYISPDNIVPFDERFVGYGFNRLSQFKAAFADQWKFSVLTPVFSIHWGLQTEATYDVPRKGGFGEPVRYEQTQENRKIYKRFLKELECKKKMGTL